MSKKPKCFLIIGTILIIVISPILFTLPSIFKFMDFSESGQIGDTIGGITSPFINLLGAILVYLSFSEQINANKTQQQALRYEIIRNNEERKYNSLISDINNLRADINDFRLFGKDLSQGINALYEFQKIITSAESKKALEQITQTHPFNIFYYLVATTYNILTTIEKSEINEEEKRNLYKKLLYLYRSKISSHAILILAKINEFEITNSLITELITTENNLRSFMNNEQI